MEKNLYIISGCNDAEKTNAFFTILPERRYINGIQNLFTIYLPIVDQAMIFDNSEGRHELIAVKERGDKFGILNPDKFNLLKSYNHEKR